MTTSQELYEIYGYDQKLASEWDLLWGELGRDQNASEPAPSRYERFPLRIGGQALAVRFPRVFNGVGFVQGGKIDPFHQDWDVPWDQPYVDVTGMTVYAHSVLETFPNLEGAVFSLTEATMTLAFMEHLITAYPRLKLLCFRGMAINDHPAWSLLASVAKDCSFKILFKNIRWTSPEQRDLMARTCKFI